jgi:excinuclease ABC subunit C
MRHSVQPRPDFPTTPGVYTWRRGDDILYIGKAKNLRNRLGSYYRTSLDVKTRVMVSMAETIEWVELESDEQALLLEAQMIKRNRPPFNVRLRDDKHYPYVAVTDDRYPRLKVQHRSDVRSWRYWGPYTDSRRLREAVEALNALYLTPLWKGSLHRTGDPPVNLDVWQAALAKAVAVLEGDAQWREAASQIMQDAAAQLNFEYAARVRDWIESVAYLPPRRPLSAADSFDVLGWAQSEDEGNLQIMQLRGGHFVGQRSYSTVGGTASTAILEAYRIEPAPARLYISPVPKDAALVEQGLGRPLLAARAGKIGYARTARVNAENTLRYVTVHERTRSPEAMLRDLEQVLALKGLRRVECYDIANLGTRFPVGAMSVMIDGITVRRLSRRWQLPSSGQDDFEMLALMISMRVAAIGGGEQRLAEAPDLIVIDGGLGQLGAAVNALKAAGVRIPVISLAKRHEEIYQPGHARPMPVRTDQPASLLLQRLRDEVHRTANARHRELRDEAMLRGDLLSDVRGIGPRRREKLLAHFGSLENVLDASQDELAHLLGERTAELVHHQLSARAGVRSSPLSKGNIGT